MEIKQIGSLRKFEKRSFYDIVYEWEDELSKDLHSPIICESKLVHTTHLGRIPFIHDILYSKYGRMPTLCFEMSANIDYKYKRLPLNPLNSLGAIPSIIDFYPSEDEIPLFENSHKRCPVTLISSLEVYNFLKDHNCRTNIKHWALSISDKYKVNAETHFKKKFDILLFRRQNPVLDEFLQNYIKERPNLSIARCRREGGHFNYYLQTEEFVGRADTREEYMQLLRNAKIVFYATQGIDQATPRARGYNQVTPTWLEALVSGCQIVARYPQNADTEYYNLPKICPSIDSYVSFKEQMDSYLSSEVDMMLYNNYLKDHYTSKRAMELTKLLKDL